MPCACTHGRGVFSEWERRSHIGSLVFMWILLHFSRHLLTHWPRPPMEYLAREAVWRLCGLQPPTRRPWEARKSACSKR